MKNAFFHTSSNNQKKECVKAQPTQVSGLSSDCHATSSTTNHARVAAARDVINKIKRVKVLLGCLCKIKKFEASYVVLGYASHTEYLVGKSNDK